MLMKPDTIPTVIHALPQSRHPDASYRSCQDRDRPLLSIHGIGAHPRATTAIASAVG
jgi:hypothetical protein